MVGYWPVADGALKVPSKVSGPLGKETEVLIWANATTDKTRVNSVVMGVFIN
jgi:hypothetical protein